MKAPTPVVDELYFRSMDEMLRRIDDRMWVAKGKPKLWVKVYDKDGITIWVEAAYGGIKLKTPEGTDEGKKVASIGRVKVIYSRGKIELMFKNDNRTSSCESDEILDLTEEVN